MLFQGFDSQFSQDFNIYFLLKFESIPNKKKFQQNHFRGKKSKNLFLEKSFFFEKVRFSRVFLGEIFWYFHKLLFMKSDPFLHKKKFR